MTPGPRILDSVPPDRRQPLFQKMSDEAVTAVRVLLTAGLLRPKLPPTITAELVTAGYARETTSGTVILTDVGQVRAFMENGQ